LRDAIRVLANVLAGVLARGFHHDADEFLAALSNVITPTSPLWFNESVTLTREMPSGVDGPQWPNLATKRSNPAAALYLAIEGPPGNVSLRSCLDGHTKAEPLESQLEYTGPTGTLYLPGSQKHQFDSFPAVLAIVLKRVNSLAGGQQNKIDTPVSFAETVDLAEYLADASGLAPGGCMYRLCGVVMHSGGHGGGHYWALVRDMPDGVAQGNARDLGRWGKYNDQEVTDMRIADVLHEGLGSGREGSPSASILFYARRDPGGSYRVEKREHVGKGNPTDPNAPKSPNRPHAAQAVVVAGMRRSNPRSRSRAGPRLDPRKARG
jgi:hypothetical protein